MLKAAQILSSDHALAGMSADARPAALSATVFTTTVIMTTGRRDGSG